MDREGQKKKPSRIGRRRPAATVVLWTILALTRVLPAAAQTVDVPTDHEAYSRMEALAEAGFLKDERGRDFTGRQVLTRQDFALRISSLIDRYERDGDRWSRELADDLMWLIAQFGTELDQMGETRRPSPPTAAKTGRFVPPDNWAMKIVAEFAEAGLVPGRSGVDFRGASVVEERDLIQTASGIVDLLERDPEQIPEGLREKAETLKQFVREPGRDSKQGDSGASRSGDGGGGLGFVFKGSSSARAGVQKGEKTDFNDRLTLEGEGGGMALYLLGELDNSGEPGADIDFGDTVKFNVTRKYLSWKRDDGDRRRAVEAVVGEVNNLEFANGLALGSTNIDGVRARVSEEGRYEIEAAAGSDTQGGDLTALRVASGGERVRVGAHIIHGEVERNDKAETFGADATLDWGAARLDVEAARRASGGRARFLRASWTDGKRLKVSAESRSYNSFRVKNNNAPFYSGISGGDDENERGGFIGLEWNVSENSTLDLSRDAAWKFDSGKKLVDRFARWRFKTDFGFTLDLSAERETDEGDGSRRRQFSVNGSQKVGKSLTFSTGYKRDYDPRNLTETLRFRVRMPVVKNISSLTVSETIRKTLLERKNTFQALYNTKLGPDYDASAGINAQTGRANRYDLSLLWKF